MNRPLIHLLALGILALGISSCTTTTTGGAASPTPEQALAMLKEGNQRAVQGHLVGKKTSEELRGELAKGQHPFAVVLGCADSRVSPEIIFDQPLGNLFVCRVAGNVTDPEVAGSIEYAVDHLHSPLIVVLGHTQCGAVKASLSGHGAPGNLGTLLQRVHPGSGLPKEDKARLDAAIANNVAFQAEALVKSSPLIRKMIQEGKVQIVPGIYSLETGKVEWE